MPPSNNANSRYWIYIVLSVIAVFAIIFFVSGSLTGNTAVGQIIGPENGIRIQAALTQPDITVNGEISQVEIIGSSPSNIFYAGDQKFDLRDLNNVRIIIVDYTGDVSLVPFNNLRLNGRASRVLVNDVIISAPADNKKIQVRLTENFPYDILRIKGVAFNSLLYKSSGKIDLNNGKFKLNVLDEEIQLGNFAGNFDVISNEFKLDGYTDKLSIMGRFGLIVS